MHFNLCIHILLGDSFIFTHAFYVFSNQGAAEAGLETDFSV